MPLTEEVKTRLKAAGREDLIKAMEINDSGFAGVTKTGQIVDRREYPDATPVPENELLGIPKPKPLP
jgi:hypothetical protein